MMLLLLFALAGTALVSREAQRPLREALEGAFNDAAAAARAAIKLTAMGLMGEIRTSTATEVKKECTHASTFKFLTPVSFVQKTGSEEILEKAGHGIATGSVVFVNSVAGPTQGLLKAGLQEFFYAESVETGNGLKLYQDEARTSAEKVPTAEKITSISLSVCEQSSEVPVVYEWAAAPVRSTITSKEKYEINIASGHVVSAIGWGKAAANAGTLTIPKEFRMFEKVGTEETVSGGKYAVTETNAGVTVQ
jgi:hypothetical protein